MVSHLTLIALVGRDKKVPAGAPPLMRCQPAGLGSGYEPGRMPHDASSFLLGVALAEGSSFLGRSPSTVTVAGDGILWVSVAHFFTLDYGLAPSGP